MSVEEAIESYLLSLRARNLSGQTIERYARVLLRFRGFLATTLSDGASLKMTSVTGEHLRKYIVWRQQSVSQNTLPYEITPLKAWTHWLEIDGELTRDPFRSVQKPRLVRKEMRLITAAGVRRLLNSIDKTDPEGLRDLAVIKLIVSTGIRRGEALGAKLADLNVPERELRVMGKGRKERRVRLSDEVALLLHRYTTTARKRHAGLSEYLFISRRGGPLDGSAFSKRFQEYVHLANVDQRVTLHQLRHFAATAMLGAGASLELVSRQLGHADSRITSTVYSHVSFQDVAAMHKVFDPLLLVGRS